jgi:hypothetical protein
MPIALSLKILVSSVLNNWSVLKILRSTFRLKSKHLPTSDGDMLIAKNRFENLFQLLTHFQGQKVNGLKSKKQKPLLAY